MLARDQVPCAGRSQSARFLAVWVRVGFVGRSDAHSSFAELWGRRGYALPPLPPPFLPSLLPFSPPSLCLAASYSLRQVTVQREALDVGYELSRGTHGWGCAASTQNWPLKQNGIIALFFVNEDEEDRLEQKCPMRAAGPTLQRTGGSRQAPQHKGRHAGRLDSQGPACLSVS